MVKKYIDKLRYVIEFGLSLIFAYLVYKILYAHHYDGYWSLKYLLYVMPIVVILSANIIFNLYKSEKKIEKIALSLLIPTGIFYLIFMMPGTVPDEDAHMYRTYEISTGAIVSPKTEYINVPGALKDLPLLRFGEYSNMEEVMSNKTDYNDQVKTTSRANKYFFGLYIFSGIGFLVGKIFSLNIVIAVYLAKIANYIMFLIGAYYTIKLIPFGKFPTTVLMFLPMVLQQATSTSADSIMNTCIFVFIALTINLLFKNSNINKKEKVAVALLALIIALSKYVYLPIVGLILLLIFVKNMDKKTKAVFISLTIVICLIASIGWYIFTSTYPDQSTQHAMETNSDFSEQLNYIIKNPINFIKTLYNTFSSNGMIYLKQAIGVSLSWFMIEIKGGIINTFLVLLVGSCFLENNKVAFNWAQRIWGLIISVAVIVLVATGLYLTWTTVGADIIDGIQGRYLLPIIPILILCLCLRQNYVKVKHVEYILPILTTIINIPVIMTIYNHFTF